MDKSQLTMDLTETLYFCRNLGEGYCIILIYVDPLIENNQISEWCQSNYHSTFQQRALYLI